ncbi:MAG: WD40 repeat domain-containing protein [Armatimonadetes bacterium]|nr:WD40 repeat domain-containing protein [Armatimonadota bacterium]
MPASLGHSILAHDGQVLALAFTPDGKRLFTGGEDRMVKVWNVDDGSLDEAFEAHDKAVLCLAVSPDGRLLATGGADCTVRIWDALTCKLRTRIAAHTEPVKALAWSPDGSLVASGGADRLIEIWKQDGCQVGVVVGHDGPITGLAFTKDGLALLSSAQDSFLKVWRVSDLGLVARLKARDRTVALTTVSQDHTAVAVGVPGGKVRLYALAPEAAGALATSVLDWNIASVEAGKDGGFTAILGADRSLRSLAGNDLPTLVAAVGKRGAVTASTIR